MTYLSTVLVEQSYWAPMYFPLPLILFLNLTRILAPISEPQRRIYNHSRRQNKREDHRWSNNVCHDPGTNLSIH